MAYSLRNILIPSARVGLAVLLSFVIYVVWNQKILLYNEVSKVNNRIVTDVVAPSNIQ